LVEDLLCDGQGEVVNMIKVSLVMGSGSFEVVINSVGPGEIGLEMLGMHFVRGRSTERMTA
jgi:hypothetical protein